MSGKLTIISGIDSAINRYLMQDLIDSHNMKNIVHIPYDRVKRNYIIKDGDEVYGLTGHLNPYINLRTLLDSDLIKSCDNIFIDMPEFEIHSKYLFNISQHLLKMCSNNHDITIITYSEHLIRFLISGVIFNDKRDDILSNQMNYTIKSSDIIIYRDGHVNIDSYKSEVHKWVEDLYNLYVNRG